MLRGATGIVGSPPRRGDDRVRVGQGHRKSQQRGDGPPAAGEAQRRRVSQGGIAAGEEGRRSGDRRAVRVQRPARGHAAVREEERSGNLRKVSRRQVIKGFSLRASRFVEGEGSTFS